MALRATPMQSYFSIAAPYEVGISPTAGHLRCRGAAMVPRTVGAVVDPRAPAPWLRLCDGLHSPSYVLPWEHRAAHGRVVTPSPAAVYWCCGRGRSMIGEGSQEGGQR